MDDIEGIGPARRKALMRHYLSLDAIRSATVEELAQLPSMNEKAAESVYQSFMIKGFIEKKIMIYLCTGDGTCREMLDLCEQ